MELKLLRRAVNPSEIQSPIKRSIVKIFLFFFVMGGMFSSVNFAINGGSVMPEVSIFEDGLLTWIHTFVVWLMVVPLFLLFLVLC